MPKVDPIECNRPRIGITMGDAAGIGPEIVVKALNDTNLILACRPVIIGDRRVIERTAEYLGLALNVDEVTIKDLANLPENIAFGIESAECGRAAGQYIETAVEMWRAGEIDAISTAPISKHSLGLGGYDHPGHTEFLASLTGTERFAMSFFGGDLRVVLLSTHVPLRKAIELVTKERLIELIRFSSDQFSRLLKKKIRLAVAGLNPHASESGMFGGEEAAQMAPAIDECRKVHGIDVSGPYSPDTIFLRAFKGEFDAVVACYHDQATIAVKSLAFGSAVNVTLGLPLIRTSVDHGTAFDIAGKGLAEAASMQAAITLAAELALSRNSAENLMGAIS